MTIRNAPYKVTFEFVRTGEVVYTITGVNRKHVGTVTCDHGTQNGLAYCGISAFRGFVQDVSNVAHYNGYSGDPAWAEQDEYVSECLSAVARYVTGKEE